MISLILSLECVSAASELGVCTCSSGTGGRRPRLKNGTSRLWKVSNDRQHLLYQLFTKPLATCYALDARGCCQQASEGTHPGALVKLTWTLRHERCSKGSDTRLRTVYFTALPCWSHRDRLLSLERMCRSLCLPDRGYESEGTRRQPSIITHKLAHKLAQLQGDAGTSKSQVGRLGEASPCREVGQAVRDSDGTPH